MSTSHTRTERLVLDRPHPSDLEDIFEIHSDPRTNMHNPAGPSSRAFCEERLARWMTEWHNDHLGVWVVREKVEGPAIGVGGLSHKMLGEQEVWNLSYRFRPESWGNGYATELARFAIRLPGSDVADHPIVAIVRPSNIESANVARKVGLQLIGRIPYGGVDSDIYSSQVFDLPT